MPLEIVASFQFLLPLILRKVKWQKNESLKIETYKSAWEGAVKDPELWAPKTRETADHSMLFSVACALADGKVVPDSFEEKRFLDDDITDIIKRCEVIVLDEFSNATPQKKKLPNNSDNRGR